MAAIFLVCLLKEILFAQLFILVFRQLSFKAIKMNVSIFTIPSLPTSFMDTKITSYIVQAI